MNLMEDWQRYKSLVSLLNTPKAPKKDFREKTSFCAGTKKPSPAFHKAEGRHAFIKTTLSGFAAKSYLTLLTKS